MAIQAWLGLLVRPHINSCHLRHQYTMGAVAEKHFVEPDVELLSSSDSMQV